MIKHYCDHCGREIAGNEINELDDSDNLFYDEIKRVFIGSGKELCSSCYDERIKAHIELDHQFFDKA